MEFGKFSFVSLSHLHSHEAKYTSFSLSSDKPKVSSLKVLQTFYYFLNMEHWN